MANKLMGFLQVGDNNYEMVDIQARQSIDDITTNNNAFEKIAGGLITDLIASGDSLVVTSDLIKKYRFITVLVRPYSRTGRGNYPIRLDKKQNLYNSVDGRLQSAIPIATYMKVEKSGSGYTEGEVFAEFNVTMEPKTESQVDEIYISNRTDDDIFYTVYGSNL